MKLYFFSLLLWPLFLFAQTKEPATLTRQFEQYQLSSLQEKLFVHTDKTVYLAGEIMWFKIYLVDAMMNKPLDLSKVVYVELLNADQKAVLQAKIAIKDAMGNGSFVIPNAVISGNYTLRAYTRWMKNVNADFFYEQQVTVINTLKEPARPAIPKRRSYDIQFFPEGGSLVYGIQSKLAFKVVDQNGEAVNCSGWLVKNIKDTVLHFATLKFGVGNFIFTPQKNVTCTAVINLPDTVIVKPIEGVLTEGYTMHIDDAGNDQLKISVHSNINTGSAVYLFVHTRHLIKAVLENTLLNGETFFLIDKKNIGDGISHFTIFDAEKKPVCERLFFKRPVDAMNINVATEKAAYIPREKVRVNFDAGSVLTGKPMEADMSVSVFKTDSLQSAAYNDIRSYLLLSSELKGNIDSPAYYFEHADTVADEAVENLMLTQGWRRFKWDDVLQDKKKYFEFLPEAEGLTIDARLVNNKTGAPAANIGVSLSMPGNNYIFRPAQTNAKGNIAFNVKDIYGNADIILQASKPEDSLYHFDVASPYADKFSSRSLLPFALSEKLKTVLTKRSIAAQVENAYLTDSKFHSIAFTKNDSTAFYGNPDKQYFLDNYTRFVTMEEVIKEFIAGVRIRKYNNDFHLRVLDIDGRAFFENDPLVLLDGLPVINASKLIAFDPLKIKKAEVVNRKYFLGNFIYDGIVSVNTYNGDLAGYPLDPSAIIMDYEGLQQQREFYSPAYENETQINSRIPDLRNQLFWLPQIKTQIENKTWFTFWTSDLEGKYAIIIQGITKDGTAGSKMISFEVKGPQL